jgi:hypothetical protein
MTDGIVYPTGPFLLVSLVYLLFRRALAVAALRFRSRDFEELEIVVLRHQLELLRRQATRPRLGGIGETPAVPDSVVTFPNGRSD